MTPPFTHRPARARTWLVALLGLLAVGAGAWWWSQRPATPPLPHVLLTDADESVAAAVRAALQQVEASPRSPEAWGRLGRVLLIHDYTAPAVESLRNAERFDPDQPAYPYLQGVCHLPYDSDEAERCFRRATLRGDRADPRDQTVRLRLVELLLALGRLDDAERELSVAERAATDRAQQQRCQYNRGLAAAQRGRWDQALALLGPLAEDTRLAGLVAPHLALACRNLGMAEKAARYSRLAVGKDESSPWPDRYLEECASLEVGRRARAHRLSEAEKQGGADALRELEALAREGSRDPLVYFSLGRHYHRLGDFERADQALRQAIALAPRHFRYHHLRSAVLSDWADRSAQAGGAELARPRHEEALRAAKEAVAFTPQDADGLLQLGRCQSALGQAEEALTTLRLAVTIRPESAPIQMLLGEVLAGLDQKEAALVHLERAVRLAGDKDDRPMQALRRARERWSGKKPA